MTHRYLGFFPRRSANVQNSPSPLPWHYRPIAPWWPNFELEAADASALVQFMGDTGQPGLEVGCGSGQRLFACRQAGLDVDGQEACPSLLALCRARAPRAAPPPQLFARDLTSLDAPRRYRGISARDVLGHAGDPARDRAALRRLYCLLEPGGTLLLDHPELPARSASLLSRLWRPPAEPELPAHASTRGVGDERLDLWSRVFDYRAHAPSIAYTVQARYSVAGETRSQRGLSVFQRFYSQRELREMLVDAGFERARLDCRHDADRNLWVWHARRREGSARARPVGPIGPIGLAGALPLRLGI